MNLLDRLKNWLNRENIAAVTKLAEQMAEANRLQQDFVDAISDLSDKVNRLGVRIAASAVTDRSIADGMVKIANSCESLERALTDRMDIIEGRLDEMKPKEGQEAAVTSVPGHKRWTQRRDERQAAHFNVNELASKLQRVGTDG